MEFLAMYDIADHKRLRKIERIMRSYGVRVQKSVFECVLSITLKDQMLDTLKKSMDLEQDTFRLYPLLNDCRAKQVIVGTGEFIPFKQMYLI